MAGYGMSGAGGGSGAIAPGRRGKSAKVGEKVQVPDLSEYMENFCAQAKSLSSEVVRNFKLLKQLDEKVNMSKEKVAGDSNTYSAAKNKNSEEMKQLKSSIDDAQKNCLEWADEKVNLGKQCLQQIADKLRQLDDDMVRFDEIMLQQQAQAEEEEAEAANNTQKSSRDRDRKRKAPLSWLEVENFVEVEWDGEWWQAKIKKVKTRPGGAGGGIGGGSQYLNSKGEQVTSVFVEYVGGQEDENEWINLSTGRIRPPSENFHEPPPPEEYTQTLFDPGTMFAGSPAYGPPPGGGVFRGGAGYGGGGHQRYM